MDTRPSYTRLFSLVARWFELDRRMKEINQEHLAKGPLDGKGYLALHREKDPFYQEQSRLFDPYPFEEMVWSNWMKPAMLDETNPLSFNQAIATSPDWVMATFDMWRKDIEENPVE